MPAFVIALIITAILAIGIKESARFNSTIVVIKVAVVLFVIGLDDQVYKLGFASGGTASGGYTPTVPGAVLALELGGYGAAVQAPELFEIGVGMREEMQIHAAVDEADIGRIQAAQARKLPVSFTVDAHPDELFHGAIDQIRLNSNTTQNVVTYPVVVKAANPDLKLLPGMTAAISFQVDERKDVVKIPNSALRFFPLPKQVRKEDVPILEGTELKDDEKDAQQSETTLSAEERAANRRLRNRRHVWVEEGDLLKAVEVVVGLTDSQFTEMVSGSLKSGDKLVIGVQQPQYGR